MSVDGVSNAIVRECSRFRQSPLIRCEKRSVAGSAAVRSIRAGWRDVFRCLSRADERRVDGRAGWTAMGLAKFGSRLLSHWSVAATWPDLVIDAAAAVVAGGADLAGVW